MSKSRRHKPYSRMTTEELGAATREYDKPIPGLPGRSLTPAQREIHRRAKRIGRPRKGLGVKVISLSVEKALLKRADALAKRRKITRADLVAEGLQAVLAKAG